MRLLCGLFFAIFRLFFEQKMTTKKTGKPVFFALSSEC